MVEVSYALFLESDLKATSRLHSALWFSECFPMCHFISVGNRKCAQPSVRAAFRGVWSQRGAAILRGRREALGHRDKGQTEGRAQSCFLPGKPGTFCSESYYRTELSGCGWAWACCSCRWAIEGQVCRVGVAGRLEALTRGSVSLSGPDWRDHGSFRSCLSTLQVMLSATVLAFYEWSAALMTSLLLRSPVLVFI